MRGWCTTTTARADGLRRAHTAGVDCNCGVAWPSWMVRRSNILWALFEFALPAHLRPGCLPTRTSALDHDSDLDLRWIVVPAKVIRTRRVGAVGMAAAVRRLIRLLLDWRWWAAWQLRRWWEWRCRYTSLQPNPRRGLAPVWAVSFKLRARICWRSRAGCWCWHGPRCGGAQHSRAENVTGSSLLRLATTLAEA